MLGTAAVKQYFATGTSHYITPIVSAEWNYNLFYAPYATFAGDGTNVGNVGNWSTSYVTVPASGIDGDTAYKFVCNGQSGSTHATVTVPYGSNTYKIVFYAKLVEDQQVTLTSLAYLDSHRSNSNSQIIDNTKWTKFETFISSRPVDTAYSAFTWTLDYTAADNTLSSYGIIIDMIQIYQTTEFDYQYGSLWPTSSPFGSFRPGESYVPSGNALTPLPTNFRKINTPIASAKTWIAQMPVSPVTYNPRLLNAAGANPLYKNGILSEWSQYKYFVSDLTNKHIGAYYQQQIYTNKIVLKFNVQYAKPDISVVLSNTFTSYSSTISIPNTSISDSGVVILYRQSDGSWTTSPWTVMPTFNLQGQITNSQSINKIVLNQTNTNIKANYSNVTSTGNVAQADMSRLQVVEISPRLELDLSYFTMNIETQVELDNKQNPLPISAISSNMANVMLSNVPLTVSDHVLSLFSNNATGSPLKGLFKKNVKFYLNYLIRDAVSGASSADKVVPHGVYYAESWDGKDIEKTSVQMFDVSKQLQLMSPTDYVSQSEDVFKVISNILDFAGFTDYDYDSLKNVCSDKKTLIKVQYFYANGLQQKVFDVLREIFEAYQIGAYINNYGVMMFMNLNTILSNKTPTMSLHDNPVNDTSSVPGLTISSNIVQDTYTETTKVKLGKATIKYRVPQINKTIDPSGTGYGLSNPAITTSLIDKNDALWTLDKDDQTTFNYLYESISTVSQNYFKINPMDLTKTFNSFNMDHDGYVIVEGEILSFRDKEYAFNVVPGQLSMPSSGGSKTVVISSSSDLKREVSTFSAESGYSGKIAYAPTGKIVNVERGLFNTPVRTHTVIKTVNDLLSKMQIVEGTSPSVSDNQFYLNASPGAGKTIVKPINEPSYNYNTFSTKMQIGPNSGHSFTDGVGGGLVIGIGTANPIYVEIRQDMQNPVKKGDKSYPSYRLYVYNSQGTMLDNPYYSIETKLINDATTYPADSPFSEFGKVVQLRFVKTSNSQFRLFINKEEMIVKIKDGVTIDTSGTFGVFSLASGSASGYIPFTELYATQSQLETPTVNYHYELPSFANSIASGSKIFEISYMLQVRPQLVGINVYDVQYSLAPAMTAYPLKVSYNWYYFTDPVNNKTELNNISVSEDALSYSNIQNSGFRGKSVVINSTPASVWLKKSPDAKNTVDVIYSINTKEVITLSDEYSLEKVFDTSNYAESIEIRTNWMQSRKSALSVLETISKAIDGFSRDTQISVYGNPLFEIGDVVKVNYSLKNISNQTYFVQGISNTFDQGLKTVLTLNQIA
jgi:hypothetical protein